MRRTPKHSVKISIHKNSCTESDKHIDAKVRSRPFQECKTQHVPPSRLLLPCVHFFPNKNAAGCNEATKRAFLRQFPYTLTMHFRLRMQKLDVGRLGETPILAMLTNPSSLVSALALSPPPDSPSRPLDILSVLWSFTPTDL